MYSIFSVVLIEFLVVLKCVFSEAIHLHSHPTTTILNIHTMCVNDMIANTYYTSKLLSRISSNTYICPIEELLTAVNHPLVGLKVEHNKCAIHQRLRI